MSDISIAAIVTAHREGSLAGISIQSCLDAVAEAEAHGYSVQLLANLDRPNDETRAYFADLVTEGWTIEETDFGDQGAARNHIIGLSSASHIAFLDGDDLWSRNWLVDAANLAARCPDKTILHPEFNWFFEENSNIHIHCDQDHPAFDWKNLRITNYWDALCFAPRASYEDFPYSKRDVKSGFGFEDWHWNCETVLAGYNHKVVDRTIHFKRRRLGSQTLEASGTRSLMRPTDLLNYDVAFQPSRPLQSNMT